MLDLSSVELTSGGLLIVGTFALVWIIANKQKSPAGTNQKKCPPAMLSLPVVGSIPFLPNIETLHIFFADKMAEKLGPVFTANMGNKYTVVLNGREAIQEALVKRASDFSDRPVIYMFQFFNPNQDGIAEQSYNVKFKKLHQLSLTILKEFGFGQGVMETRIQAEVDELESMFKKTGGRDIDPNDVIVTCVCNVIASIIFGQRFKITDPKLTELVTLTNQFSLGSANMLATHFLPILRFLPRYRKEFQRVKVVVRTLLDSLAERIQHCLTETSSDSFVRSFVQREGENFDRQQLLFTIRDLFFAGTETTTTTLRWALIFLANYPEIQEQLQKEVDSEVPKSRHPMMEDRARLPLMEAFILEVMRFKTIVPLALPHLTACDTEVGGFFIPANTGVIPNIYSVHMSKELWPDRDVFRPERFLDTEGKVFKKELVIPFALGKRSCLGENLARQEIYLFTSAIVQQFDIRPPEGQSSIVAHEIITATVSPTPYKVRLVERLRRS